MTGLRNLTSFNSVFAISVAGIFPTPIILDQFATDKALDFDEITVGEHKTGVDGKMSYGLVATNHTMKIHVPADSDAADFFEEWYETQVADGQAYFANANWEVSSTNKNYTLKKGALLKLKYAPDYGKVLGDHEYALVWESIERNAI